MATWKNLIYDDRVAHCDVTVRQTPHVFFRLTQYNSIDDFLSSFSSQEIEPTLLKLPSNILVLSHRMINNMTDSMIFFRRWIDLTIHKLRIGTAYTKYKYFASPCYIIT